MFQYMNLVGTQIVNLQLVIDDIHKSVNSGIVAYLEFIIVKSRAMSKETPLLDFLQGDTSSLASIFL